MMTSVGENYGYTVKANGLLIQTVEDTRHDALYQWGVVRGTMKYPIAFTQKPFVVSSVKGGGGCELYVADNDINKTSLSYDVLFVALSGRFDGARFLLVGF